MKLLSNFTPKTLTRRAGAVDGVTPLTQAPHKVAIRLGSMSAALGYGSGTRYSYSKKTTVEDCRVNPLTPGPYRMPLTGSKCPSWVRQRLRNLRNPFTPSPEGVS